MNKLKEIYYRNKDDMDLKYSYIQQIIDTYNKPINNDVIKNALNNNFHIILGERSNDKKAFLESLGYKVISYKEYLKMKVKK